MFFTQRVVQRMRPSGTYLDRDMREPQERLRSRMAQLAVEIGIVGSKRQSPPGLISPSFVPCERTSSEGCSHCASAGGAYSSQCARVKMATGCGPQPKSADQFSKGIRDVRLDFHNEGVRKLWHALAMSLTWLGRFDQALRKASGAFRRESENPEVGKCSETTAVAMSRSAGRSVERLLV
jgi:hypothetical protein